MEYQKIIDLIDNKIPDRITKVSKKSQQNNWETVTNENDKEIPKKEEREKGFQDLILIE